MLHHNSAHCSGVNLVKLSCSLSTCVATINQCHSSRTFDFRRTPISQIPYEDETKCTEWVHELFQEKVHTLKRSGFVSRLRFSRIVSMIILPTTIRSRVLVFPKCHYLATTSRWSFNCSGCSSWVFRRWSGSFDFFWLEHGRQSWSWPVPYWLPTSSSNEWSICRWLNLSTAKRRRIDRSSKDRLCCLSPISWNRSFSHIQRTSSVDNVCFVVQTRRLRKRTKRFHCSHSFSFFCARTEKKRLDSMWSVTPQCSRWGMDHTPDDWIGTCGLLSLIQKHGLLAYLIIWFFWKELTLVRIEIVNDDYLTSVS